MNTCSRRILHMSSLAICAALAMALLTPSHASAQVYVPGGRLTLVSNTPIMTADVSSATTIYYTSYVGNNVPYANGTTLQNGSFASQLTLNINTSLSFGNIYDIFIFNNAGTLVLCTGPAWSSSSSRGTGAGTTQLTILNGLSVNANAMSSCMNGATSFSVAVKSGFYLGSVYMTGIGQTSMQLKPTAAAGGTGNVLGLWNAYNRVRITAYSRDSTSNWSYGTASWRAADNSTSNRIYFIDGLQQSQITGNYSVMGTSTVNTVGGYIGLNVDSTTTTPNIASQSASVTSEGSSSQPGITETFYPLLGVHYVQAVEYAGTGSGMSTCCAKFYGFNASQQLMALAVTLDM